MEEIDGVCCHVECSGEGQGVILLHGWGQNLMMMRLLHRQLQDNYRVLSLDLPGFGQSKPLPQAWTMDDYVPLIHHLADRYHMKEPILIAHSFGARIAIRYACSFPVPCMVLTGAAGLRAPLSLVKRGKQQLHHLGKYLHLSLFSGSEDYRKADPILKRVLVQAVNEDLAPLLPSIHCPILLVWGSEDRQTPLWMGRKMETLFERARLIVYHDDDHFAYYHQGFRFAQDVRQFLGETLGC